MATGNIPQSPLPGDEGVFERDGSGGGAGVEVGDQGVGDGVGLAGGVVQNEVDGVGVERPRALVRQGDDEDVAPRAEAGREEGGERTAGEVVVPEEEGVGEVGRSMSTNINSEKPAGKTKRPYLPFRA